MQYLKFILLFISFSFCLNAQEVPENQEFKQKLGDMYNRINKSLEILREQVTENQSAPFLANLYMQLGDLLMQKANVLYYIKMEATKGEAGEGDSDKKFRDVIDATKEAVTIYEKVVKEFPKFEGRKRALYAIAVGYKSIDEKVPFLKAVEQLKTEFPTTQESVKGQLLLGQHTFDAGIFDESARILTPLLTTTFPYERNAAKHKMGLIKIYDGKHAEALELFRQVVLDKELQEKTDELEVELESKSVKSNLKREALIDSVRAYTEVYKKDAVHDAVKFYSDIAPSESLFREVMEKLAFRYINLKRYDEAIKILRTLSERTPSPEQVINIYKEVLLMIPLNDRVELPVEEIRYVLEKYLQWSNFFTIDKKVRASADDFFEKQLRDLGTRSHEVGKNPNNPKKLFYLNQSIKYYEMYLATFPKNKFASKMAMNLGDSHFRKEDYLRCADIYLRIYKGEFGKTDFKDLNLKNAVYCAEKDREYSFYELRRVKGLLIESLGLLMKTDKSKAVDSKTNFALAKAFYDQGFYKEALDKLFAFMKKFPTSEQAVSAANLILDYFNIKSDFDGLVSWGNKILALNLPNKELNEKVNQIKEQAKVKKLQAQVESSANFDGFAQGKSYLANAANIQNVELRNLALQRALEASKRERDIDTFLQSAQLIASKEADPKKRYEIEASMASEHVKMGNYEDALGMYRKIFSNNGYGAEQKQSAFNEAVNMSVATRDWQSLGGLARNGLWKNVPANYLTQAQEQVTNMLESPMEVPAELDALIRMMKPSPTLSLGLFKARNRLSAGTRAYAVSAIKSSCGGGAGDAVCRWTKIEGIDRLAQPLIARLRAPGKVEQLEQVAGQFAGVTEKYTALEGADGQLDMLTSLRLGELYKLFGLHLKKVAESDASLKQLLMPKAQESFTTGTNFLKRCGKIVESSNLVTPTNRFCKTGNNPSLNEALTWSKLYPAFGLRKPGAKQYLPVKKEVFASYSSGNVLKLASTFYKSKDYNYALGTALYGLSTGGDQGAFNTVLGCSVLSLGYLNEANFYLSKGDDYEGMKSQCLSMLKGLAR
jgi:hypothetical protein